jgi:hypothetical protein
LHSRRLLQHILGFSYLKNQNGNFISCSFLNEDPYAIGDGSQRNEYKLVSLISINAQKRGSHIAVRDALEDAGFDLEEVITVFYGPLEITEVKDV